MSQNPENPERKVMPESDPDYYAKGSIHESFEGRPLDEYIKEFNVDLEDIKGKIVLDLGAGLENRFAEQLKERGVEVKVISLSPDFSDKEIATQTRKASPEGNLVAGRGQKIPFADASFDREYALHVHDHIVNREILYSVLEEIARTLKGGGIGKMGPWYDIPGEVDYFKLFSADQELRTRLSKFNAVLEKEKHSPEMRLVKVKDYAGNAFYVPGYSLVIRKITTSS